MGGETVMLNRYIVGNFIKKDSFTRRHLSPAGGMIKQDRFIVRSQGDIQDGSSKEEDFEIQKKYASFT